jgi:hypothetical protein
MKKLVLVLVLLFIGSQNLSAQGKWRREMLLQIAALKVYMGYAQKGYSVVRGGLHLIGDLKKGEVKLHGDYFNSLKKVNPRIKNYSKVVRIVWLQLKIIKIANKTIKGFKGDDLFHGSELDYIERCFARLFENCNRTLDELVLVTTDTTMVMTDDQRLERINALYETMLQDYTFCESFTSQALLLSFSKDREKKEIQYQRVLQGL